MKDVLLEKETELTNEEKDLFRYFGEHAKIRPPFRILNPHRISIGDYTSIREGAYIQAFETLARNRTYIDPRYIDEFNEEDYTYDSEIIIGRECQINRFLLLTATNRVELGNHVGIGQCTFIGDNNHVFAHPYVPIIQQPNEFGRPVFIGNGTWIGINGAILSGTTLGRNTVVGANSVVQGNYPDHAVICMPKAQMLFRRYEVDGDEEPDT